MNDGLINIVYTVTNIKSNPFGFSNEMPMKLMYVANWILKFCVKFFVLLVAMVKKVQYYICSLEVGEKRTFFYQRICLISFPIFQSCDLNQSASLTFYLGMKSNGDTYLSRGHCFSSAYFIRLVHFTYFTSNVRLTDRMNDPVRLGWQHHMTFQTCQIH